VDKTEGSSGEGGRDRGIYLVIIAVPVSNTVPEVAQETRHQLVIDDVLPDSSHFGTSRLEDLLVTPSGMSSSIGVSPVIVFSQPDSVQGSENEILIDSEITSSLIAVSKGTTFVGHSKADLVLARKRQSIGIVSLQSTSRVSSEEISHGCNVSIDGSSIQIGGSVVEGVEDAINSDAKTPNGEDTSLVVRIIGFQKRVVRFDNSNLIVFKDVGKVEEQGVLSKIVRDHLTEGDKEMISSQPIWLDSNSSLSKSIVPFILEGWSSEDTIGDNSLVGSVVGKRSGSF
jgi:hypothetical protein